MVGDECEVNYIAHINDKTGEKQSVSEHSRNVAEMSGKFAIDELADLAFNAGLFHDIGKYQADFQRRISGENVRVEHSGCGAQMCMSKYQNILGFILGYCIAGHHSGLPDGGSKSDDASMSTLYGRIKRKYEEGNSYSQWETEEELGKLVKQLDYNAVQDFVMADCSNDAQKFHDKLAFWIRYCFSCLTDADTIDTAKFCGENKDVSMKTNFSNCLAQLDKYFLAFKLQTKLQKKRKTIQEQVFANVDKSANIYTINMPTGSGKTLCSVKFALEKAITEHKKRIIYVIPYNSIIDQTAKIFENIFGSDMELLRHQSTFSYSDEEYGDSEENVSYRLKAKYNTENWQADFIITTAVQFFETICSHKKSRLRKLHNMADSVIIFDEVHQLPIKYLRPCLQAVSCVTKYLNSLAVFMTATMPDFKSLIEKYAFDNVNVMDLVTDKTDFTHFYKCRYHYLNAKSNEFIVQQAQNAPSALIIVNARSTAREIFSLCTGEKYHLSTYMTARDREKTIAAIKAGLAKLSADYPDFKDVPPERRICVVSTSLIEAGVDLDFYTVYRELNGLDSILQAGGRCNREGYREYGDVYIFEQTGSNINDKKIEITRGIVENVENLNDSGVVADYYDRIFKIYEEEISKLGMSGEKGAAVNGSIPFRDIDMHIIDDLLTTSLVVIQDENCKQLIDKLQYTGIADMHKLQKYSCTIYNRELEELLKQGVAKEQNGIAWLVDNNYYDENIGVIFEGHDYIVHDADDVTKIDVSSTSGGIIL